ncbi:hypothetical protein [Nonlabens sp.]|uniref:hypothetical protein n=1 Tax=Nonlabens sp. TaxID=1888209 RepID=UPI003F695E18
MSNLFSISLSLFILLQSFGISVADVAQMDEFIEHAQYHSEQYGDNVFVFISKHYGELKADHDKEHQEEKEDHEELPFNHNNCSHIASVTVFVLHTQKQDYHIPELLELRKDHFFYQEPSSSIHSEGPFQPPRFS